MVAEAEVAMETAKQEEIVPAVALKPLDDAPMGASAMKRNGDQSDTPAPIGPSTKVKKVQKLKMDEEEDEEEQVKEDKRFSSEVVDETPEVRMNRKLDVLMEKMDKAYG